MVSVGGLMGCGLWSVLVGSWAVVSVGEVMGCGQCW